MESSLFNSAKAIRTSRRVVVLVCAAACWPLPSAGQSLSLRKIADADTSSFFSVPKSVNLAPTFDGGIVAGAVAFIPGTAISDAHLVDFSPTGSASSRTTLPSSPTNLGLGIDDFGQLSYVAAGPGSQFRVGNELAGWPDHTSIPNFVETAFPEGGPAPTIIPFSYEIDRNGLPAVASLTRNFTSGEFQRDVWKFNPQIVDWDRIHLPGARFPGLGATFVPQSIAFTADNRLVHATLEDLDGNQSTDVSVLIEDPVFGFRQISGIAGAYARAGVSVAASDTGEVAFAFVAPQFNEGVWIGRWDGEFTVYENLDSDLSFTNFGQNSLAYDAQGNLALVYTEGATTPGLEPQPLMLARRTADGAWTNTPLGVDGFYGELAFGDNGELYIGAVIDDAVVLLSDTIDPLRGDLNFDEVVDLGDVLAFVQAIESPAGYADEYGFGPVFKGDLNGDGVFNLADVEPFVTELGLTGPAAEALASLVPEPGTAGLFAAAGLWFARGRRLRR